MDPSSVDLVLAVRRTGIGQDARTHACPWGLPDRNADFAKLIEPCTSCCEANSGSLYGGLYGGSDDRETVEND
jgi:hypothetical protein